MMTFRVLDFETDGMPPEARICEIGWVDVRAYADVLDPVEIGDPVSMLINTGRPMPPEARAVHHISEADLVGAPNIDHGLMALADGPSDKIFVAHNCEFEKSFFAPAGKDWICTLKVARRLWPECPSHANQCLRYWLGLELADDLAMPPHRAAPDSYVTAHILLKMLEVCTVPEMIAWTNEPSLLPRVIFGKYRNQPWSSLPPDYLSWLVTKSDMDADTKYTARHYLELKRQEARAR